MEVTKARAYNLFELAKNPYDVQNMLIVQHNFPLIYHKGDFIGDTWSDRIPHKEYEEASRRYFGKGMEDGLEFFNKNGILDFLKGVFEKDSLTGFRIVRFTNVSSGYPCYRFDAFAKSEKTPIEETYSGQNGENVEYPEEKEENFRGTFW